MIKGDLVDLIKAKLLTQDNAIKVMKFIKSDVQVIIEKYQSKYQIITLQIFYLLLHEIASVVINCLTNGTIDISDLSYIEVICYPMNLISPKDEIKYIAFTKFDDFDSRYSYTICDKIKYPVEYPPQVVIERRNQ